jgi:hypothetical protein
VGCGKAWKIPGWSRRLRNAALLTAQVARAGWFTLLEIPISIVKLVKNAPLSIKFAKFDVSYWQFRQEWV